MASFASADKQAEKIAKILQQGAIRSVGTVRNYQQALKNVINHLQANRSGFIRDMTPAKAVEYLEIRGEEVGQKSLDMERQALQAMMIHVSGKLKTGDRLPVVKSEVSQVLKSRSYTIEQVGLVSQSQSEKHSLATEIAHTAGLRAHELLTILPATERAADLRPAGDAKFVGREGKLYTVVGKGGLCRQVVIPSHLAERLEATRINAPVQVTDRGIYYMSHYAMGGGNQWSASFSSASNRALGWSAGGHGVRHSYAQERMTELQANGLSRAKSLETVSQEMGHFRPEITEIYLR